MLKGMMKKIVKIMKAINSGNYSWSLDAAYCFVDVAFVAKVQSGQFHWEPYQYSYDQRKDVYDVWLEYPQLVYLRCEDNSQIEDVEEEVIVEHHLKREGRAHWCFQHPNL